MDYKSDEETVKNQRTSLFLDKLDVIQLLDEIMSITSVETLVVIMEDGLQLRFDHSIIDIQLMLGKTINYLLQRAEPLLNENFNVFISFICKYCTEVFFSLADIKIANWCMLASICLKEKLWLDNLICIFARLIHKNEEYIENIHEVIPIDFLICSSESPELPHYFFLLIKYLEYYSSSYTDYHFDFLEIILVFSRDIYRRKDHLLFISSIIDLLHIETLDLEIEPQYIITFLEFGIEENKAELFKMSLVLLELLIDKNYDIGTTSYIESIISHVSFDYIAIWIQKYTDDGDILNEIENFLSLAFSVCSQHFNEESNDSLSEFEYELFLMFINGSFFMKQFSIKTILLIAKELKAIDISFIDPDFFEALSDFINKHSEFLGIVIELIYNLDSRFQIDGNENEFISLLVEASDLLENIDESLDTTNEHLDTTNEQLRNSWNDFKKKFEIF